MTRPAEPAATPVLSRLRLERWCQTSETRISGPDEAAALIDRVGIATLYPASPEIPNLFHAYVGNPDALTDSGHHTPSGQVYGWRWDLGRAEAAFYTSIARHRPTWVSWTLLPAVLRLIAEQRTPDELYDLGVISPNAYRIAQVLEEAGGALSTGDLRREAGFPIGKEQRAAFLKGVDELEIRLLLAKVFSNEDLDMRHSLVSVRYPKHVQAAESMTRDEALDCFLLTYLPQAVYVAPQRLAKHLKIAEEEFHAGLERLLVAGRLRAVTHPVEKTVCYAWVESE